MTRADIAATTILGVNISAVDMPGAVRTIESWIESQQKQCGYFCTVHSIMEADKNPEFREVLNGAALTCPDGMPLVWISQRQGKPEVRRVCGPDLMLELCARSVHSGHRHYFYGGNDGVVQQLAQRLIDKFPGIQIAGMHTPQQLAVGELEHPDTIAAINAAKPDIVWVGLGCPKQEWWAAKHRHLLNAPALLAVGAAFDFHSGAVKQAPQWMQRHGLEWSYRLTSDPKRLWKRYLLTNTKFLLELAQTQDRHP